MKFNIGEATVDIDITPHDDEDTAAEKLASLEVVKAIAVNVGKNSYFEAYPAERDMDSDFAAQIATAYLSAASDPEKTGMHAVEDFYAEGNWDLAAENEYAQGDAKQNLRRDLSNALEDFLAECEMLDEDTLIDALEELLKEDVIQAMYDSDTSTIAGSIPSHVVVEMPFVPDNHLLGIDDLYTHHLDVVFSAETAIADANLMRALKFFNVAPSEYVAAAKERGIDLLNPEFSEQMSEYRKDQYRENALRWAAVLDAEKGANENIRKLPLRSKYEINEWNETAKLARTAKDHDRPAAVTMDNLFTTLDNASYGGVPVYVARLPLKDLLEGKFDRPFTAKGGFVGIHDFINGSGYIDRPDAPVLIDPSKGSFRMRGGRGSIDDVYGNVGSYYRAEIEPYEVSPWQRVREDKWLRIVDDGREATIVRSTDEDGAAEFWVQTFDAEGSEAGPWQTAEVWTDLDEAKSQGDKALSAEWQLYPAP